MVRNAWSVPLVAVALLAGDGCSVSSSDSNEAEGQEAQFFPIAARQSSKKRPESIKLPPPAWPIPATTLDLNEARRALLRRLVRERAALLKPHGSGPTSEREQGLAAFAATLAKVIDRDADRREIDTSGAFARSTRSAFNFAARLSWSLISPSVPKLFLRLTT
jgi:hypothetical protein